MTKTHRVSLATTLCVDFLFFSANVLSGYFSLYFYYSIDGRFCQQKFRAVREHRPVLDFYLFFSIPKNFLSRGARNVGERRSTIFIKTSRRPVNDFSTVKVFPPQR